MLANLFNKFEEGFLNLLISLMTLLVFGEVIARFFFNTGFLWIQELTLTFCGWFVLFGMSYGVKVGAHIDVDAFVSTLSPGPKRLVALFASTLCVIYCGMFLKGSWDYLSQMYQIGLPMEDIDLPGFIVHQLDPDFAWEVLKIDVEDNGPVPVWMSQSILLIGFSMLAWRFIQLTIAIFKGEIDGFKLADEAKDSMHLIDDSAKSPTDETHNKDEK